MAEVDTLRIRSRGPPSASNTCSNDGPNPLRRSRSASSPGVRAFSDNARMRAPGCSSGRIAGSGRPQNDSVVTSCNDQPSRAQASENAEGAGTHRVSSSATTARSAVPTPKQYGSPDASTTTVRPRRSRIAGNASASGDGHCSCSPLINGAASARWRAPPTTNTAPPMSAHAADDRPSTPSSPIPRMASHRGAGTLIAIPRAVERSRLNHESADPRRYHRSDGAGPRAGR